jgi:hypothetical protein
MKRCFPVVAVALMVSLSSLAQSKQKIFHLAIGDPERRMRDAHVLLEGITDVYQLRTLAPKRGSRKLAD